MFLKCFTKDCFTENDANIIFERAAVAYKVSSLPRITFKRKENNHSETNSLQTIFQMLYLLVKMVCKYFIKTLSDERRKI
jgi:hypothetical protein